LDVPRTWCWKLFSEIFINIKKWFPKLVQVALFLRELYFWNLSFLIDLCLIVLSADPYVIVKLYKGDTYDKKETLHIRNTRSPKFHETFQFHLVTDFEYPLTVFSLVVTVANRQLIGRDDILGHVIFSLDSPQPSAIGHWKEVQTEPHKSHSRWHSLLDPDDI